MDEYDQLGDKHNLPFIIHSPFTIYHLSFISSCMTHFSGKKIITT